MVTYERGSGPHEFTKMMIAPGAFCLKRHIVNHYGAGGRMGLHQDKDEGAASLAAGIPVVSVSRIIPNTAPLRGFCAVAFVVSERQSSAVG